MYLRLNIFEWSYRLIAGTLKNFTLDLHTGQRDEINLGNAFPYYFIGFFWQQDRTGKVTYLGHLRDDCSLNEWNQIRNEQKFQALVADLEQGGQDGEQDGTD